MAYRPLAVFEISEVHIHKHNIFQDVPLTFLVLFKVSWYNTMNKYGLSGLRKTKHHEKAKSWTNPKRNESIEPFNLLFKYNFTKRLPNNGQNYYGIVSYDCLMISLWCAYDFPTICRWFVYGFPEASEGFPSVFLWFPMRCSFFALWCSFDFP